MNLSGFHRPLQRKGYSNRYSSENARQFNRISVRERMARDVHVQVLLQQLKNARDETDDEFAQIRLRAVRRSIFAHMNAFYRKVMPAALFASTVRRNLQLDQIVDFCGDSFRFRRRSELKRVMDALRLPEMCGPFENRAVLPREACFLYALRWTAHEGPAKELRQFFGGEKSMWSRAYRYAHVIDL